jgi:hypothetical protein
MVPAPPVTMASFVGGGLASGTRSWDALAAGHDAAVQMIDTSVVRVRQHGAWSFNPGSSTCQDPLSARRTERIWLPESESNTKTV